MKLFIGLLMGFSNALPTMDSPSDDVGTLRERRSTVKLTDCPGRCWEIKNEKCVPKTKTISLDCSSTGRVKMSVDTCLFTPDGAKYKDQKYTVNTLHKGKDKDGKVIDVLNNHDDCQKVISKDDDVLTWDLTYKQAKSCGFQWAATANALTFGGKLRASENINSIMVQGLKVTLSAFPADIDMKCIFDPLAEVNSKFNTQSPTTEQDADQGTSKISLGDGFSFEMLDKDDKATNTFTIGQAMKFNLNFDYAAAGYKDSVVDMPFGFTVDKCHVQNEDKTEERLYIIGSGADGTVFDKCLVDDFGIDLKTKYAGDKTYWSSTSFGLGFNAFRVSDSDNLNLVCNVEVCLTDDCPKKEPDCSTPGQWAAWGSWGPCTKSCGTGIQLKTRLCEENGKTAANDRCVGSESFASQDCNTDACPVAPKPVGN